MPPSADSSSDIEIFENQNRGPVRDDIRAEKILISNFNVHFLLHTVDTDFHVLVFPPGVSVSINAQS